jgi:accessory gene regulator B
MSFSQKISKNLTNIITEELGFNEDKKEIIAYGLETFLLLIIGWLLLIIFGYFLNALIPVIVAAIFGGLLRKLSGGAHFNSPLKCLAFGTLVYCSLGVFAKKLVDYNLYNEYVLIICLLGSFLLVAFLAPVDSEAKPIHSKSFRIKLKISSIIFVIITLLIIILSDNNLLKISAVEGICYQSITLLPVLNNKEGGRYRI